MDKREARKEFKTRITPKGVFAIRCIASGHVWVGASGHLDSARNSLWFVLRNGLHLNKLLQETWNTHGESAFQYEIVESFDDDVPALLLKDLCRERQKHWEEALQARSV